MPYQPTNWTNREVERPRTYVSTTNEDGTITLTPSEGTVFVAGTPIVAENMNNIENQLVVTDEHINNTVNPHNVTAAQINTYTQTESDNKFEAKGTAYPKATSDARYAYKEDSYTKAESDSLYVPQAGRAGILFHSKTTRAYPSYTWSNVFFTHFSNQSDIDVISGYELQAKKTGWYLVVASLSYADAISGNGHVLLRLDAGTNQFRLGATHYTSSGNFSVNGSAIAYLTAGESVKLFSRCSEEYSIFGAEGEIRSYMSIRELV